MADLTLEYLKLTDVVEWDRNPKDHEIGKIILSIRRFGYRVPMIYNDRTGVLMAGHGRLHALRQMRDRGEPVPDGIRDGEGDWLVPVVRGADLDPDEAGVFALVTNYLVSAGGWHGSELAQLQKEMLERGISISDVGWDEEAIAEIIQTHLNLLADKDEDFDSADALGQLPEPRMEQGEIWRLGDHRLMCGDATDAPTVAKLLNEEKILLMITDPPYGVQTDHSWRMARLGVATKRGGQIAGDTNPDWEAAYRLWPAQIAFVWHSGMHSHTVRRGLENVGYEVRQQVVWVKRTQVISRSHYHWKHEPCWYAVRKGKSANWQADRRQTTVWEFDSPIAATANTEGQDDEQTLHPTQKPLKAFEIPIANHTVPGDLVSDPFVGSGTAIIAAERMGRRCVAMDIDPKWCEVAIQRWESYTGREAEKIG